MRAVWCAELELAQGGGVRAVEPWDGQKAARVLVRVHGEPLGYLTATTDDGHLDLGDLSARARETFAATFDAHLAAEGLPLQAALVPAPTAGCPNARRGDRSVSVVVCTRDRAEVLERCLRRLRRIDYPALELIVVDNAPSDDRTRLVTQVHASEDPRVRYVVEPRPGLSCARNRGLAEATGSVIAYTDDDVSVDEGWVDGLLRGLAWAPDVACVTGLVCTASINSPAEAYFDARSPSWSARCVPEVFDMGARAAQDRLYPYSPGIFGTGASVAFDRQVLVGLGGFDEALGAGTPTRGGEDLDIFLRVLRAGRALVYMPTAVVWHHHRADDASLSRQLFGYGTGLSALFTKLLLDRQTRRELLVRVPVGLRRAASIRRTTTERLLDDVPAPAGALRREISGLLAGPLLYRRSVSVARASRSRAQASDPG